MKRFSEIQRSLLVAAVVVALLVGCTLPGFLNPGGSNAPSAPGGVTATAGDGQVVVSWNSVSGATSYNLYWKVGSTVSTSDGAKLTNVSSPKTVGNLPNGTQHAFIVTAVNANGESSASSAVTAVPTSGGSGGLPIAPTSVTAAPGNGQVTVGWASVSGATSYNLYWKAGSAVSTTDGTKITGVTSPKIVGSLTNGTQYAFIITAVNASGEGSPSSVATATPSAGSTGATVNVTTDINAATVWQTGNTYHLAGQYSVNAELDIQPGVTVKCDKYSNYGAGLVVSGTGKIVASGTTSQPIVFTSSKEGTGATPAAGDWWGIDINGTNSSFSYCTFRYAGNGNHAAIRINESDTSVQNCTFTQNIIGLDASNAGINTSIAANSFYANTGGSDGYYPVYINTNVTMDDTNILTDSIGANPNAYQGIAIIGDITVNQTLHCTKAPYVVIGSVPTITHKLTIEPGVTIKFDKYSNYGSGLYVDTNGQIDAEGTAAQPITFTSIKEGSGATPAAGDWSAVNLGSSSGSTFSWCTFKYAGNGNYPALEMGTGSSNSVTNCSFTQNVIGLDASYAGVSTSITGCAFYANTGGSDGYYPVYINTNVMMDDANILTDSIGANPNAYQGIAIFGDITVNQTLHCTKAPYVVIGSVPTITHKLTIEPGVTIKFDKYSNYGSGLYVDTNGQIDAEGTAAQPITFTSIKEGSGATPAAGDWSAINLGSSSGSTFSWCTFKYAGNGNYPALEMGTGSSNSVTNCSFLNNVYGIDMRYVGVSTTVSGNSFSGNLLGDYVQ